MRIFSIFFSVMLGAASAYAALPVIPGTNEVVRYQNERGAPSFQTMSRERGDALLSILEGGRQIQEEHREDSLRTIGVISDYFPSHADFSLNLTLTNGSTYRIGIGKDFVDLPEGHYEVKEAAREKVAKVVAQMNEDLRQKIVNAPRPLIYAVGTVDDGDSLSGIAHLFYGDSTKWKKIYEANQKTIKNPNFILPGMKLTIPKLQ